MTYLLLKICKQTDDAHYASFLAQVRKTEALASEPKCQGRNLWQLSLPADVPLLVSLVNAASQYDLEYQVAILQEEIVWTAKQRGYPCAT